MFGGAFGAELDILREGGGGLAGLGREVGLGYLLRFGLAGLDGFAKGGGLRCRWDAVEGYSFEGKNEVGVKSFQIGRKDRVPFVQWAGSIRHLPFSHPFPPSS